MDGLKQSFTETLDLKKNMVSKSYKVRGSEIQFLFKERSSNFIMETKAQVIKVYVNGSSTPYVTIDFEVIGVHIYEGHLIIDSIITDPDYLHVLREALDEYAVSRRVNHDDIYRFELFYKGLTGTVVKEV